jgi:hypothetical protein
VRSRAQRSALAPEGMRPNFSPGFWYRVQGNDRPKPITMTFTRATPCVIGECLVIESDAGNNILFSSDWDLVEQRTSAGLTARFNPLRVYQWPLKVGSSWSYMSSIETSQGAKIPTRVTASVVSYESVTVPAGTFMAFRTDSLFKRPAISRKLVGSGNPYRSSLDYNKSESRTVNQRAYRLSEE